MSILRLHLLKTKYNKENSSSGCLWLLRGRLHAVGSTCRSGRVRVIPLLCGGDNFTHARETGLPCHETLLKGLPLLALEGTCRGADDVEGLRGLRKLAKDQLCAQDCRRSINTCMRMRRVWTYRR